MALAYHLRNLYEASPEFVRRSAGSVAGLLPLEWRYGPAFSRTWHLLRHSEQWDPGVQLAYQLTELRSLLHFAQARVPYYRHLFDKMGFHSGDIKSPDDIRCLPLLTREMVRELGADLLAEGVGQDSYKYSTTAGTSAKPLGFYVTHDASAAEWAFMLKNWERAGYTPKSRRVVMRGRLIGGRRRGRLWEHDPVNQALFFSSFDLSDANLKTYLRVMQEYRPDFLHAFPSSATLLAQYLQRCGQQLPSLRALLLGSENLYPAQRQYLETVFGVRVFSWYGHSEKCILAGECEHSSNYHVFPEYGITELVNAAGQTIKEPGTRGQLVGTGFINRATVLIRYLTDDEAEWCAGPCRCGRTTPQLCDVRGRWHQEFLVGSSGALISAAAINLHTRVYTRMRQFQFFQESPGRAKLRIVKAPEYTAADEADIVGELTSKLESEIDLAIEYVAVLPPTVSGKFKFVDQRIPIGYPEWDAGERE